MNQHGRRCHGRVRRGDRLSFPQIERFARYLVGENPFDRERHWNVAKHAMRHHDRGGVGPVDIALWDLAGKYADLPICDLLGRHRTRLPAYASTYPADVNGGLDSPAAFADFAAECSERGFPAFKIHPWGGIVGRRDMDREIRTVRAVGERVGDDMHLMHDPASRYETFADALSVGRACDEYGYLWYEDPYYDGGYSMHAHRRLRDILETPLLLTEYVRGVEAHTDFIANEATDFVRADPDLNGGITGSMKIVRIAEGFGLDVELHLPRPARRHCMAAIRNTNYYELGLLHPDCGPSSPPVYADGYSDDIDAIDGDETVTVPDGPGLGVEYDEAFIDENRIGRTVID